MKLSAAWFWVRARASAYPVVWLSPASKLTHIGVTSISKAHKDMGSLMPLSVKQIPLSVQVCVFRRNNCLSAQTQLSQISMKENKALSRQCLKRERLEKQSVLFNLACR